MTISTVIKNFETYGKTIKQDLFLPEKLLKNSFLKPFKLSEFLSLEETIIFYETVKEAICKGSTQFKQKFFDMGFGSSIVGFTLLQEKLIGSVAGLDIDEDAINIADENRKSFNINKIACNLIKGDVFSKKSKDFAKSYKPDIIGANLPYLPIPKGVSVPQFVNGGIEGLKFTPNIVLEYVNITDAPISVITSSSLNYPEKFFDIINASNYKITKCNILIAPFGIYTSGLITVLENNPHSIFFKQEDEFYQCIFTVVLEKGNTKKEFIDTGIIMSSIKNFQNYGRILTSSNKSKGIDVWTINISTLKTFYRSVINF